MEIVQYTSIIIEVIVAILGLVIGIKKKKDYGYAFFLTFAIYVFYDYVKLASLSISASLLSALFFIASLSALYGIWRIYNGKS